MSHARVEEVSDSEPDDAADPDEMDIEDVERELMSFDANHPAALTPATGASQKTSAPAAAASSSSAAQRQAAPKLPTGPTKEQLAERARQRDALKKWQCLYPVYFDASRSRVEGRRVSKKLAVPNPLAREIWDAASSLGFQVAFEPENIHPKDWANPGRVRVALKEANSSTIKNKHHLYIKIAEYLQSHPTTTESPLRLRLPGMPANVQPPKPPEVPRGWKMGSILPFHSAAVSGGGVSENLFKDMMAEVQATQGGSAPAASAAAAIEQGGAGKKKDKKKGKA